jgi:hypothetical protein
MKQKDYIKHHSWQNNKPFPHKDLEGNDLSSAEITFGSMLEKYGDMFWSHYHDSEIILLNGMYKSKQVHIERISSLVFEQLTRTGLIQIEGGQSS